MTHCPRCNEPNHLPENNPQQKKEDKKWSRIAQITVSVFVASLVIAIVLIISFNSPQQSSQPIQQEAVQQAPKIDRKVAGIDYFSVQGDGREIGSYRITFSLFNAEQQRIAVDGAASFVIYDKNDNQLYMRNFAINASDFQTYALGNSEFLAYGWTLPTDQVMQGTTGYGYASLMFMDMQQNIYTATADYVLVPQSSS